MGPKELKGLQLSVDIGYGSSTKEDNYVVSFTCTEASRETV